MTTGNEEVFFKITWENNDDIFVDIFILVDSYIQEFEDSNGLLMRSAYVLTENADELLKLLKDNECNPVFSQQ